MNKVSNATSVGELVLELLFGVIVLALVSVVLVFSLQAQAQQTHVTPLQRAMNITQDIVDNYKVDNPTPADIARSQWASEQVELSIQRAMMITQGIVDNVSIANEKASRKVLESAGWDYDKTMEKGNKIISLMIESSPTAEEFVLLIQSQAGRIAVDPLYMYGMEVRNQ